jgi:hypothetical protein
VCVCVCRLNSSSPSYVFICCRFQSFVSTREMSSVSQCDFRNDSERCMNNSIMNENSLFIPIFSILLVIVMFIGVMGNLLVIYVVLNYGRLKTVTNTYLLHLALSDLIFLSGIPFFLSYLITRGWIFGGFVCKLFFLTQGVNQYTSVIILALLSFDRYLAVCYSAQSIIWRTQVNPNLLLLLTWILSFILMLPIISSTTIQSTNISTTVQCIINLPFPQSRLFYYIFSAYTLIITFFLPISLMTYFYMRIVNRLKQRVSQQYRRSRTSMRTRRKVSVLVLAVISVHICCCSPYWATQVITISELLPQTSSILLPLSSISQLLLFVNSSTNPILYAFLSEIFRFSFKRVFYCCLTADSTPYCHDKTITKRNLTSAANQQNCLHNEQEHVALRLIRTDSLIQVASSQKPRLSLTNKSTNIILTRKQDHHLSLAPTMSMFSSDTSFA